MTSTTSRWCLGWQRPPHVPDGGALIVTNLGPDIRLCRVCWSKWNRTDRPADG